MRILVTAAIFALAAAVGCAQGGATLATVMPDPVTPTTAPSAVPTIVATPLGDSPAPAASQTRPRRAPRPGPGFVPLDDPSFLTIGEAGYLGGEELVLGVEWAGESRAYPVRMLRYHHVINDTVGGRPLLVTY